MPNEHRVVSELPSPHMLLFLYYLFMQYGTPAMSVPSPIQQEIPLASSSNDLNRSLFNIIWSCLSTTIICAWVSIHPNVPPRSKLSALSRRLWMMFWTTIAPELVLAWAVRQRYAARMVQMEFKDRRWTEMHGHFLIMGGFTLINGKIDEEPEKPEKLNLFSRIYGRNEDHESKQQQYNEEYRVYNLGPVSFEDFKKLVDDSEIDFPAITTADIEDKSKGDLLFKTLVIIQTTWFLLQCAARIPQRLALTELELVTLALASLNAVTYFFWWNKPLQVQEPVKLFLKTIRGRVGGERNAQHGLRNDGLVGEVVTTLRNIMQAFCRAVWRSLFHPCKSGPVHVILMIFFATPICLVAVCFFVFPIAIASLLDIRSTSDISSGSQSHRTGAQVLGRVRLKLAIGVHGFFKEQYLEPGEDVKHIIQLFILIPLLFVIITILILFLVPFFHLIPFLFDSVFNIITTDTIPPGSRHVPSFYAPKTTSDQYSRMIVFAFFGVIFGGLHMIGWFFEFPTPFERTLWCVTAIVITGIPLIVAPIDFLIARNISSSWVPRMPLVFVMTILLCIYVPARLSLIAQAIALLRHQPPSAFVSVQWTKFIPHVLSS